MKKLRPVKVLGTRVQVLVTSSEEAGKEVLGETDYASFNEDDNTIRLNSKYTDKHGLRQTSLVHELGHAWVAHSGARHYLRTLLRMTSAEFDAVEENLVRMLEPAITSSIPDLVAYFPAKGSK